MKPQRIYVLQTSTAGNAKGFAVRTGRKSSEREEHGYEKMAMNEYLSIITLNINGLHSLIKSYRIAEWIRKHA